MRGRVENLQTVDGFPVAGAEPGNKRAVSHGCYSLDLLEPKAKAIAEDLRELMPAYTPGDEPAIWVAALALARLQRAQADIDEHGLLDKRGIRPIVKVIGNFQAEARRALEALSMTPATRAKLGLDHVKGQALAEHLARHYPDGGSE